MSFTSLIFGRCSVGYAFINFEDVSGHPLEPTSRTLIIEQPYSIIDVGNLCNRMKGGRLTLSTVRDC